jgi:hypothetical protein
MMIYGSVPKGNSQLSPTGPRAQMLSWVIQLGYFLVAMEPNSRRIQFSSFLDLGTVGLT